MLTATKLAIETTGLVKTFGSTHAVDGLDLAVPLGGVYGVLGPNGAGKTTAIRMLATLLPLDGGTATVLGHDVASEPDAVRSKVSLTGQFASLDEDLTGSENLLLLGRLYGYSRAAARTRSEQQQILAARQILVERGELPGEGDLAAHGVRLGRDVVSQHGGGSTVEGQQRGQHADRGGLARAVRSEDAVDAPEGNGQIQAVDRVGGSECLDESRRLDGQLGRCEHCTLLSIRASSVPSPKPVRFFRFGQRVFP